MSYYESEILKVVESLYPSGRAWNYARSNNTASEVSDAYTDGVENEFTDGQGNVFNATFSKFDKESKNIQKARLKSWARVLGDYHDVLWQILPDNDNFTVEDAINWERQYSIDNSDKTLEERKEILLSRLTHPNGRKYRQTPEFLQEQLQSNGFDLYVHENREWDGSKFVGVNPKASLFGNIIFGEALFGNTGIDYNSVVKNYIDKETDGNIKLGVTGREAYLFFIGASVKNTFATVQKTRESELREIILKTKPMHSIAVLQINYI